MPFNAGPNTALTAPAPWPVFLSATRQEFNPRPNLQDKDHSRQIRG